jgi:hypothetical protein
MLIYIGFTERVQGYHYIFVRQDVTEILNLQPNGSQAKPYQVKQFRNVIIKYHLGQVNDEQI